MITLPHTPFWVFHNVRVIALLCLLSLSCSDNITNNYTDSGEEQMGKLVASQITELTTTANPLGSFVGDQLANLQMDELEPGEFTLQFEVLEPPIDGLGYATYAYIVWKVAGQQISRIISVFNGAAISGVANSVHVKLQDQSERTGASVLAFNFNLTNGSPNFTTTGALNLKPGQFIQFQSELGVWYTLPQGLSGTSGVLDRPFTGPTGGNVRAWTLSAYKVAVALSKGTRAATMQPPVLLTQINVTVGIGLSQVVPLPPSNAGVLSVLTTVTTNAGDQTQSIHGIIAFSDANGILLARYVVNMFPLWYPVPPGTARVALTNTSTTTILNFSLQWGIEG